MLICTLPFHEKIEYFIFGVTAAHLSPAVSAVNGLFSLTAANQITAIWSHELYLVLQGVHLRRLQTSTGSYNVRWNQHCEFSGFRWKVCLYWNFLVLASLSAFSLKMLSSLMSINAINVPCTHTLRMTIHRERYRLKRSWHSNRCCFW